MRSGGAGRGRSRVSTPRKKKEKRKKEKFLFLDARSFFSLFFLFPSFFESAQLLCRRAHATRDTGAFESAVLSRACLDGAARARAPSLRGKYFGKPPVSRYIYVVFPVRAVLADILRSGDSPTRFHEGDSFERIAITEHEEVRRLVSDSRVKIHKGKSQRRVVPFSRDGATVPKVPSWVLGHV